MDHVLAVALHPNYKSLKIIKKPCFERKFDNLDLIEEIKECCLRKKLPLELNFASTKTETEKIYAENSDSDMDEISETPCKLPKMSETIFDEYVKFMELSIDHKYENPVEFWQASDFILLKKLALSLLVTQASSSEPERHNSSAGLMMIPLRNRTDGDTLESLVIYNELLKNINEL